MIALSKNFKVLFSSVGEMLTQLNMSNTEEVSYIKKCLVRNKVVMEL